MQTFVWDGDFITGIDAIDRQHHGLVDLFNALAESLMGRTPDDDARAEHVYARLVAYAEHHFKDEEDLMESTGLDMRHFVQHRDMHRAFVDQVHALWATRDTLSHPAEVFLSFLTSWLGLHVLGIDQSMVRQLRRIQQGDSPDQAFAQEHRPKDHSVEAMSKAMVNIYKVLSKLNLELSATNRQLERRVSERTQALEAANAALQQANRRLEVFAQTDGLLGIANRSCFDQHLHTDWQHALRAQKPLALLMIDVDHFKSYNDHYGHLGGDRCLQELARTLGACLQRSNDLLARYGGEELVVLLPNTDLDGAAQVGEQLRAAVAALGIAHAGQDPAQTVGISVGVAAMVPHKAQSATELVQAADAALYAAKTQGRNRVCCSALPAA